MRFVTAGREGRGLRGSGWKPILAILCIALVLFTGILQVTHSHPNGHIDPDCSLCMSAHHAAQVVVVVTVEVSAQPVMRVAVEKFSPLPRQRFVVKLANRPPPVPSAIA
jgi:hypothetical protein